MGDMTSSTINAFQTLAGVSPSQVEANAATNAANQANATQQGMFNTTQQNLAPYMQQGLQYQNSLSQQMPGLTKQYDYSQYLNSPEYMNAMAASQQGQQNMLAQGAASGMLGSGNMASGLQANAMQNAQQGYSKGLSDYWGQNQNVYNMLAPLAASGQNAAAGLGGLSQQTANSLSNNTMAGMTGANAANTNGANNLMNGISSAGNSTGNQIAGGIGAYNQNSLYSNYLSNMNGSNGYNQQIPDWNSEANTSISLQ